MAKIFGSESWKKLILACKLFTLKFHSKLFATGPFSGQRIIHNFACSNSFKINKSKRRAELFCRTLIHLEEFLLRKNFFPRFCACVKYEKLMHARSCRIYVTVNIGKLFWKKIFDVGTVIIVFSSKMQVRIENKKRWWHTWTTFMGMPQKVESYSSSLFVSL